MTASLFFKMLTASVLALFTAIGGIFMPGQKKEICMIAHRGYSGVYHQNTEIAFQKAAEHGSGGAETDVRMTKDGVYVVCHNEEAVLKDGTELLVSEHTFAELTAQPLKAQRLGGDQYLCTFKRYLEIMRDNNMICFIELKDDFTDEQVKEIFTMAGEVYDLSKCIMQSFYFDNLIRTHEAFPELGIMLTYGDGDPDYRRCLEYGFSIDTEYTALTEEMVEEFHSRGLEVAVWTANDPLTLAYCKSFDVDYIESDFFA
ncbi:MAG: hypothetical protein IK080_11290 [Clostridia bacterium]|nr:hypothetical protein [Clostridia bacterium]